MQSDSPPPRSRERVPTGVPGLDAVLRGGLLRGGVYIVFGNPGTGKTILANQVCFDHVASGGRAIYVTLLAETHGRLLSHLEPLRFFDPAPIAHELYYVSGYRVLERDGLESMLDLLRRLVRDHKATMLVLDSLVNAEGFAASTTAFKRFIHELHTFVDTAGCTTLLLTPLDGERPHPEYTIVDGLIELSDQQAGLRAVREIEVLKIRGSSYLRGRHSFDITDAGIVVYPRTEALLGSSPAIPGAAVERVTFGIARFDEMLHAGLPRPSSTLVLGPTGSGKTMLGLHFLATGAASGAPGLHFGFYESPAQLLAKARGVGIDLARHVDRGVLAMAWQPALENVLDELAERLLNLVRAHGIQRLVIDGLDGFVNATVYPERLGPFFTALTNELQALGVATILTAETRSLFSSAIEIPISGVSAVVQNIISLRTVELRSHLHRLVSIIKVRDSDYDPAIRELRITQHGIEVGETLESAETISTRQTRPTPAPPSGSENGPESE